MNTYEAMFIFPSSFKEEAIDKVLKRIEEEIVKLNGRVNGRDIMGKRAFARPINKHDFGQYIKLDVSLTPESIAPLRSRFQLIEGIVRVQIVKQEAGHKAEESKVVKEAETGG